MKITKSREPLGIVTTELVFNKSEQTSLKIAETILEKAREKIDAELGPDSYVSTELGKAEGLLNEYRGGGELCFETVPIIAEDILG